MAYFDKYGVEFSDDRKTLIKCPENFLGDYDIPNGVAEIGAYAFCGCKKLLSIVIPNTVTHIAIAAFELCNNLTSVSIPEGVEYIGTAAFWRCENLVKVNIPRSVRIIENQTFKECPHLNDINVSADNTHFCSIDGVLFNKDKTILIRCPEGKYGKYIIPQVVKEIREGAFENCVRLTNIEISNAVSRIWDKAFIGCDNLQYPLYNSTYFIRMPIDAKGNYTIPDEIEYVLDSAFENCYNLSSINIPNSIRNIGKSSFRGCHRLQSINIPRNISTIESDTFGDCSTLTSISIPSEITSIKEDAFRGCAQLKNINVSADNTHFCSIDGVLFSKDKTMLIRCPEGKSGNYIVPENTRIIGYAAFIDCKKLINIVIVNTCIIKEWAFSGCSELRCIIFTSGVKNIGWNAFANCDKLSQICVPINKKSCFVQFEGLNGLEDKIKEFDIDGMGKTKYIFFDTETTGVPRNYRAPMQDTANWPRLVQLAWLLVDEKGTELKRKSVIIRPDGFSIPEETVQVHGITTERAQKEGLPLRNVLDEFMQDLELAEEIVGHNIDFDIHIVGAELCRLGLSTQKISNKPTTCTMKSFTDYCAIPSNNGYGGYKWPTLEELYYKVFGYGMENAHDALADILATKECFFELKNQFKAKASSVPMSAKRTDLSDLPF